MIDWFMKERFNAPTLHRRWGALKRKGSELVSSTLGSSFTCAEISNTPSFFTFRLLRYSSVQKQARGINYACVLRPLRLVRHALHCVEYVCFFSVHFVTCVRPACREAGGPKFDFRFLQDFMRGTTCPLPSSSSSSWIFTSSVFIKPSLMPVLIFLLHTPTELRVLRVYRDLSATDLTRCSAVLMHLEFSGTFEQSATGTRTSRGEYFSVPWKLAVYFRESPHNRKEAYIYCLTLWRVRN